MFRRRRTIGSWSLMKICYGSHFLVFEMFCKQTRGLVGAFLFVWIPISFPRHCVDPLCNMDPQSFLSKTNTSNHLKLHRRSLLLRIRNLRQLAGLPHHLMSLQIDGDLLLLLLEISDQVGEQRAVLLCHQRNRESRRSRTTRSCASPSPLNRTSNSVDVELQRVRHVVIHDQFNALNIQTASRHVGRHHNIINALSEVLQRLFAATLLDSSA